MQLLLKAALGKSLSTIIASQMIVQELHCIVLSTADDLVHKSKVDQLETLLKESFGLCHRQPDLAVSTTADSSADRDWSWMRPVHSLSHNCISCAF